MKSRKAGKKEGKKKVAVILEPPKPARIGVEPPEVSVNPSLRVFLFSYFKKSMELTGKFPPKEEVAAEIAVRYPASVFNQKVDKHFSYYKALYHQLDRINRMVAA